MKLFIEPNGTYNYSSFEADGKKFTIVGSETPEDYQNIFDMMDTFKSSDGVFSTRTRRQIQQAFFDGKITPVQSSMIVIKSSDGKTKRRAV